MTACYAMIRTDVAGGRDVKKRGRAELEKYGLLRVLRRRSMECGEKGRMRVALAIFYLTKRGSVLSPCSEHVQSVYLLSQREYVPSDP